MSDAFEDFQRDFLHANTWPQRKDGVPLDLLDRLSDDERILAEDQLIEAASDRDTWPILGLGHLRSVKALPTLYALLEKCSLFVKINVAVAIYQINRDGRMADIVLEDFPKITNEYSVIDGLYLLRFFQDSRITALLERYTHDTRYLVAYNAARYLGRPTEEIVKKFRQRGKFQPWWRKWLSSKSLVLVASFLHLATIVTAQDSKIDIPSFNDKYATYVSRLESGDLNIDYADFRNSFLDSKQFRKKGANYDSLKRQVYTEIKNKNYLEVERLTKAMLSIDYTSLFAHKYLQQTYNILGDTVNQKKYHDIEFGLLNSIVKSGDGKTCETGWHVTQIEEEYFILGVIDAKLQRQSVSSSGKNVCDKMEVKTEDGEATYYFEANKVFEMERKLFEK